MPGYIHGLIQVKFSILVKDWVGAGRERGTSEGVCLPHRHELPGGRLGPAPHTD